MKLTELLSEKRPAILNRWFDVILETYHADTSIFLKNQKDQFANPIGYTLKQGTEAILDALLSGADAEKAAPLLDGIIRIRAVQEGLPSSAIVFILLLKVVIREMLGESAHDRSVAGELVEFESRIDAVALRAFDSFMKCREKIYEIKTNETKNMTFRLLQKAQMISQPKESAETPAPESAEKKEMTNQKQKR
ncbi:MAG: RsbRD N-terminal domain-containing protein [Nitrospirae bacterium]|nr:RsbRD N-terminal domain-containing protein [Nitrospirota bacterium]